MRPPKIPESVLVVIHTAELDVLLIERADKPGYWQSVTGSKDRVDEPLAETAVREVFMKHHGDLLDVAFWQGHKDRILAGHVHDVFPYDSAKRFKNQRRLREAGPPGGVERRSELQPENPSALDNSLA